MTMVSEYSFGGDEHLFVKISESMSIQAFAKALTIAERLKAKNIDGVTEICPANASLLVRFDPDVIAPEKIKSITEEIDGTLSGTATNIDTRFITIPVFFNDPWTTATAQKFRDRRQEPDLSDIEFAAKSHNMASVDEFVHRYSAAPWIVTMVGFVAGLPFCYQLVPNSEQIQLPKYLRPRTDTPKLTIAHGGCFCSYYSVRGAGGYQMLGISPAPIFEADSKLTYFQDSMIFFKPGDIIKYRPISQKEYERLADEANKGTLQLDIKNVTFSIEKFMNDPSQPNLAIEEK